MDNLFDILFEKSSSASSLSDFLMRNMQVLYDFHSLAHRHLVANQESIDRYIQKKHTIISQLSFTDSYNKAFVLLLLDDCLRLNLIASSVRIYDILQRNKVAINSRQQAAILPVYPKISYNSELVDRFELICKKLQDAVETEEDDKKQVIATFLNYFATVIINTPTKYAEQVREKLVKSLNEDKYPFLHNEPIPQLQDISLENRQEAHSFIRQLADSLLEKQDPPAYSFTFADFLIETGTAYASDLQKVPPTFTTIRSLSLSSTSSTDLTDRGVKILESEAELCDYMRRFGNMHRAKLEVAYNSLPTVLPAPIHIIDWGCGQGFASMLFIERFGNQGIRQITLIEPSNTAIKRAALHIKRYAPDLPVKTICKKLDDVTRNDLFIQPTQTTVHLFSNILDIDDYSPSHLIDLITSSSLGLSYFVCVSPHVDEIKTERLESFRRYFEQHYDTYRLWMDLTTTKNPDDIFWSCNNTYTRKSTCRFHKINGCNNKWTRVIKVFEIKSPN